MKSKGCHFAWLTASVLLLSLIVAGCSSNNVIVQEPRVDLLAELQKAARELMKKTARLDQDRPVIITTLVNIDDLQQSSTFGRQVSEVFSSAIASRDIPVVELKMRETVFVREGTGELVLSRELRHLSTSHDAQAVLAGTYAVGGKNLYVNVRIIKTTDNRVLGSHNFSLPINGDIRSLLSNRR